MLIKTENNKFCYPKNNVSQMIKQPTFEATLSVKRPIGFDKFLLENKQYEQKFKDIVKTVENYDGDLLEIYVTNDKTPDTCDYGKLKQKCFNWLPITRVNFGMKFPVDLKLHKIFKGGSNYSEVIDYLTDLQNPTSELAQGLFGLSASENVFKMISEEKSKYFDIYLGPDLWSYWGYQNKLNMYETNDIMKFIK